MLGSFFGYLLKLETQKESTTSTFINWFKNSNVVVVVDGVPTLQKAKTATNRTLTKIKEFEKFKKQSNQIVDSKHNLKRVSKAKWETWEKLKRRTFELKDSQEFIYFLNQVAAAGIKVIHATGEADVWITKQEGTVMSGDCDLLFHGRNTRWLIPTRMGTKLEISVVTLYNVLDTLSFSTNQLRALAIVSGNDYSANLPGYGIKKNYKIIKKVSTTNDSCTLIISKYCKDLDIQCFAFQDAIDIFAHGLESLVTNSGGISSRATARSKLIDEVLMARDCPANNNESKLMETLHINNNWIPNKFRPIGLKSAPGKGTRYEYKVLTAEKMAPKPRPKPLARESKEYNTNAPQKPKMVYIS